VPETETAHQLMPEKRGKMRKITVGDKADADAIVGEKEKRQRKKWSTEETQMLVDGCNRVCFPSVLLKIHSFHAFVAWSRQLEDYPQ
jgi:hypothetical protein